MPKNNLKHRINKRSKKFHHHKGKGRTKTRHDWEKYFREYQELLKPMGIYMRDVEGDGNCLFRAVSDQLEGTEKDHKKYRTLAAEYIIKNKDYFQMFLLEDENIDKYIAHLCEDGSWGGHFEMVALSDILNVKFCIHAKDKELVVVKSHEGKHKDARVLHLAYHMGEHYSSIRKIGDNGKTPAQIINMAIPDSDSEDTAYSESDVSMSFKLTLRDRIWGYYYKIIGMIRKAIRSVMDRIKKGGKTR